MNEAKHRLIILDLLKGAAILAVVLYHFGGDFLPYGYLGVDIFFVVSGYLLIRSLLKQFEDHTFHYFRFVIDKVVRLWPLILIAAAAALVMGFFLMLPDDYENVAQSVIASSVFANNILAAITTRDYWDVVNLYKPLMHTWYIAVLMQVYVILPLLLLVFQKCSKHIKRVLLIVLLAITALSLTLYLMPNFATEWKFYYFPFRLFEITCGGLLAFCGEWKYERKIISAVAGVILACMLCARNARIPSDRMLLVTVACTLLLIYINSGASVPDQNLLAKGLAAIGQRSYSIFIWHQVIVAFLFYSVFPQRNVITLLVFLLLTAVVSICSFQFLERPMDKRAKSNKGKMYIMAGSILLVAVCGLFSLRVYMNAGVVRDVPELEIEQTNVHRHMHAEYCDRPYSWDVDFTEEGKIHVLVFGNSFARDCANILYESQMSDSLEISYFFYPGVALEQYQQRIEEADFVFAALGPGVGGIPNEVTNSIPAEKLYVVGNKSYGESNGLIYAQRGTEDYYEQSIPLSAELLAENTKYAEEYGSHYIDLLTPIMNEDGSIRVFTSDHKFISQDCLHLTRAGAQYYSEILDLKFLIIP